MEHKQFSTDIDTAQIANKTTTTTTIINLNIEMTFPEIYGLARGKQICLSQNRDIFDCFVFMMMEHLNLVLTSIYSKLGLNEC